MPMETITFPLILKSSLGSPWEFLRWSPRCTSNLTGHLQVNLCVTLRITLSFTLPINLGSSLGLHLGLHLGSLWVHLGIAIGVIFVNFVFKFRLTLMVTFGVILRIKLLVILRVKLMISLKKTPPLSIWWEIGAFFQLFSRGKKQVPKGSPDPKVEQRHGV